jgi:sugar phosphate permease
MCVTMGIHGLAQAMGWPHNVALFANWSRKSERGTLFGIWGSCYQVGSIAGKALAGFLLGLARHGVVVLRIQHRAARVHGVLRPVRARAAEVGRPVARRRGGSPRRRRPPRATRPPSASPPLPEGFVASIVAMGLIYIGLRFVRYALDSWSVLIMGEQFGMDASVAAYWSTAFDWVGFLGIVVAGYWSDRIPGSRRTPVIFWMTAGCLVFTVAMWSSGFPRRCCSSACSA